MTMNPRSCLQFPDWPLCGKCRLPPPPALPPSPSPSSNRMSNVSSVGWLCIQRDLSTWTANLKTCLSSFDLFALC